MSRLRIYWRLSRLLLVVALGALLAGAMSLLETLARRDLLALRQRLTRWWMRRLRGVLPYRVSLSGELPRQPMLWVANHVSWTDIPLLGALQPLSFLSKAEVRAWPLMGWLAEKAGTLFIRRGSGDSGQVSVQLASYLQRGRTLLIFPEGTTSDGVSLRTFHGRLLASAIDTGVPVQPVAIRYWRNGQPCAVTPFIGDDDLRSHLFRLLASPRAHVHIQLLPPIDSRPFSRNELARHSQALIESVLDQPPGRRRSAFSRGESGG